MATDKAQHYNEKYRNKNYFNYEGWRYARYVSSLVSFCRLREGASVLDVGCGQGFFSHLLAKNGMSVYGIDISETGIHEARASYGHLGIKFEVADFRCAQFPAKFDCIFVRACSLYNTKQFPLDKEPTQTLLRLLRDGGVFIFLYGSNFSSKSSPNWRYHSLRDVSEHFARYPHAQTFFSTKIDTIIFGKFTFSRFLTSANAILSRVLGIGGDLICVFEKKGH